MLIHIFFSDFSSIYEVFLVIGFSFYGFSNLKSFMEGIYVDVLAIEKEYSYDLIMHQNNIEAKLNQPKVNRAPLEQLLTKAIEMRRSIEEKNNRIVRASRIWFILLGLYCFCMLVLCGFEQIYSSQEHHFYCNKVFLFCITTFAFYLTAFIPNHYIEWPFGNTFFLALLYLGAFIVILLFFNGKANFVNEINVAILSILMVLLPFTFFLFRSTFYRLIIKFSSLKSEIESEKHKVLLFMTPPIEMLDLDENQIS